MKFGSLFSGIGGIDLGLERAGMKCEWQVEIDEYCQKVLQKHWPHVTRYGDVRECGKHNLTKVDLIAGGFPCQDVSNAGKKAGIEGERSGLWKEFYRVIYELRPHYVLVENVSALLNRGMGRILGDLASIGYDAEWEVLPACAFGAPHRRDRVFIVAYLAGVGSYTWRAEPTGQQRTPNANGLDTAILQNPWSSEPSVSRVVHGVPYRLDRVKGLGNSVVPQIAEYVGRCILG